MIHKTFDYEAAKNRMMERIEAELAARTPAQVEEDQAKVKQSWKAFEEILARQTTEHKQVANLKKLNEFLLMAKRLKQLTKQQGGWIRILVDENWNGKLDLRFADLHFMDIDHSHSHETFALLFQRYRDITFSIEKGKVRIQVFCKLYELVPLAQT